MTSDAVNLLAEIRRSGGDVRLVGTDRLKLVAPTALLPELTERVRAAKPMLVAALAHSGRKPTSTQEYGCGVSNPRHNSATAQHLTSSPLPDRAVPIPAADWRARHREALAYWSALRTVDDAAGLVWGEMQTRWHRLNGERAPEWQCAGCGEPVGGRTVLTLADSNRVHFDKFNCLLRYGERWRSEASAGLKALGLPPPAGNDL